MTQQEGKVLFEVNTPQPVTDEEIDNVMVSAFEGGITYWCHKAEVKDGDYKDSEFASGVVSKGGTVILHYSDDDSDTDNARATLDLAAVQRGIPLLLKHYGQTWSEWYDNHDACSADNFIQFAVFGELVYG